MKPASLSALLLCLVLAGPAAAETAYVTGEINVGLHQDRTLDSPIVKLVPTGTELEIVKKESPLSSVRDADGVTGWVDNSYLASTAPAAGSGGAGNAVLEQQLAEANQRAEDLEARLAATPAPGASESQQLQALRSQLATADQQLKEERLRSGELQVQAAEARKRAGMDSGNAALYEQIDQLEADKKTLEVQLAAYQQGTPLPAAESAGPETAGEGWRKLGLGRLAAYIAIFLLVGFGGGMYFFDYLGRRRHGGFRI